MSWGAPRMVLLLAMAMGVASCGNQSVGSDIVSVGVSDAPAAIASSSPAVTSTTAGSSHPQTICRGVDDGLPAQSQPRSPLPDDFVAVVVVRCSFDFEQVTGDGEWRVMVEERATAGLDLLRGALRQSDSAPWYGACRMNLDGDPEVWFVDAAGHAVLPRWPRDGCWHVQAEATAALDVLVWTTTARVPIEQTVPQAAIDAGCPSAFKSLVGLVPDSSTAGPGSFADLETSADPRLCRYQVATGDPDVGTFDSGRPLSTAEWAELRAELDLTPAAEPCDAVATRFVLLTAGPFVEVEIDGCHRVLTPDDGLRQATPDLLALLT